MHYFNVTCLPLPIIEFSSSLETFIRNVIILPCINMCSFVSTEVCLMMASCHGFCFALISNFFYCGRCGETLPSRLKMTVLIKKHKYIHLLF